MAGGRQARRLAALGGAGLWLASVPGFAQNGDAGEAALDTIPVAAPAEPAAATAATAAKTGVLETVIVTARRVEERAQDVPISLAVLDGAALNEAGLSLPTDVQERVPGLVVNAPNARLTQYTIRGLGSTSANDGMESSVGLFLDGVYLGRQGLSMFDLVDLDRVEILRGPQGTLFGKNTTAGAISIVTKAPTHPFESALEGTYGSENTRQLRGTASGELFGDDTLAGRLTGYYSARDGLIDNRYDGSRLNNRHKYGARAQALWTPHERLSARFIAEYGYQNEHCCVYPLVVYRDTVRARDEFMEYQRAPLDPYRRQTDSDTPTHSSVEQRAASVEFNRDIGAHYRLTGITAYRDWFFAPLSDDATSLKLVPQTGTQNGHHQFSQELRLSLHDAGVDAVGGLFFLRQRLNAGERNVLGRDLVGWTFGGIIRENALPFATQSNFGPVLYALIPPETLDGTTIDTRAYQVSDSGAAFGSVNWQLAETLELTTGLRYTREWKRAAVARTRYGGHPELTVLSADEPALQLLDGILGTDLAALGWNGILDDVAGGDYARSTHYQEGNASGQLALSWHFVPGWLGYASVARGYKSGGINLGVVGNSVQPTFRPERTTAYELGLKGQPGGRARLAAAIYQTDVRDYQALTFDAEQTLIPNPRQINLLNVGRVRLRGVELDGEALLAAGLRGRLGAAWSQAISTHFPDAPDENTRSNTKNLSGALLYNAPRWSATSGLEYEYALHENLSGYAGVDYAWRSGYWGTVEHGAGSHVEAYGLANLRLGLRSARRNWDVQAWLRNVFDAQYVAAVYPLYGVGDYGAVAGDPRSCGLTLRASFE